MRRPALLSVAGGCVVLIIGALAWWRPFVLTERETPAVVPQSAPLFTTSLVDLRPGSRVCFAPAVMNPQSGRARFRVQTFGRPGPELRLTIAGEGYRSAREVPAGYLDAELLDVPVPAPRRDTFVRVCIANTGRRRAALMGSSDQTRSPMRVTSGGEVLATAVQFWFYEPRPVSIAARLPLSLDRMQVFRPGFLGPWLFWPLAIAFVVGVPAGALWALWRAASDEPVAASGEAEQEVAESPCAETSGVSACT